ncbi:NB-ARC domain-containing protein [Citrus sinensis]|uniref:NB-ARC domain-containing protein n=1 Tax=Citrus sinensis TaxID=2711 RepID=A0ACB8J7Y9_CITSI|nr:NB-ARC domain-containing protein [Citrus sinensis]
MAAEATIVPVVRILKELSREKFEDKGLVTQLEDSIKVLENVRKSLEEREINDVCPVLLNAVSQVQDITDTFRIENCKRVYLGVISFRSSSIQARFRKKITELVSGIQADSEKMPRQVESSESSAVQNTECSGEISEKITSAENVDSAKKTGILDSNKEVNKLADFLIRSHSSLFTISVVDVAGSVMTTDLWKLYESETVKEHFQCRAWVPVPEELERREFVTDVLKQVGGSEVEKNPQTKLRNLFTKKRYLVVIINARTPDIWDILKYLFPNSSNGSRVILSFQEADAARCRNMSFFGGESSYKPKYIAYAASEDDGGNDDRALPKQVPDEEISEEVTAVVSMENDILKLAKLTLNSGDKNFFISVAGAAGSGKTALVKTIYDSSYTKKNFPCRAWANVYVSQDFDMRSVFADILRQLTQDEVDEESSLDDLESEFTRTLYEKRYLVVLDDVHSPGAWYDLKRIFSPQASPIGSRVILITREAYVARSFSPSIFLHQLRPLNEEESGKLFQKKVGSVKSRPDSNLLQKIFKLCSGLPLAISVVGGFLSNKDVSNWSREIEKNMPGKKQGAPDDDQSTTLDQLSFRDISSIWVFANKSLSPHLKACLHYFRLFPKSYEVSVRRLLQLWLAERLETPIEENYMAPEDQVKTIFDQLELMNMIEVVKRKPDGKPKTCRVPSSLSDNLFPKAESGGVFCIHGVSRSNATSGSSDLCVRRLAELLVNRNNSYASGKHLERLHSYLSFDNRKGDKPAAEVGNLLNRTISKRGYRLLRVLDLERVYKPVLPETIGKLRLLRHVGLRWTFLDSIPKSLGDLPSLETLDVKRTNIATLPKSIWKSSTLRHLYMSDIRFQLSAQKPFVNSSLTKLQTLWGLLIGKKSRPLNWLRNSKDLRKLGLTFHFESLQDQEITKWIKDLEHLESLMLRSVNDFLEPSDLDFGNLSKHKKLTELYLIGKLPREIGINDQLPEKLTVFTLSLSHLSKDPMPVLGQLKELKILRLFAHSYIGEQMTCQKGWFPQLLVLKLWVLKELKRWSIEKETMPKLRELEIRRCQKLKNPFESTNLTGLKELTLTDMGKSFEDEVKQSLAGTVNVVIIPPVRVKHKLLLNHQSY